jgi:hypothetical protein
MPTPEDIAEAKRIANARAYAQKVAETSSAPAVNPNALADLQASVAAGKQLSQNKSVEIATIALEMAVNKGDKNAIVDAAKAVAQAQGGSANSQAANAIAAVQEATPQPVLNDANIARGDQIKWVGGVNGSWQIIKGTNVVPTGVVNTGSTNNNNNNNNPKVEKSREFLGSGASRVLRIYYTDGSFQDFPAAETTSSNVNTGSITDPATLALIKSLQDQLAALNAKSDQAKIDQAAAAEAAKKQQAENAISVLTARFAQYGLQTLVPKIRELAIGGATEATITLQLQETPEYRLRFKANQDRIKKGLSVLDPGDYIGIEDKYRQILRAYGLSQFDNDNYVSQFIANDVSSAELSSRVQTAVQRVQNADPAVLATLTRFYGIGSNDLVGYVLDPEQQFQKIERQVAAAEIGAAAKLQGFDTGVSVAEQLAAQGVTKAEAQKGYSTIGDILPTAQKLSQIYGNTLDNYGLAEAEQEVFNSLASAQRKRRKLVEREVTSFSGSSGMGRGSLSQQVGGTF